MGLLDLLDDVRKGYEGLTFKGYLGGAMDYTNKVANTLNNQLQTSQRAMLNPQAPGSLEAILNDPLLNAYGGIMANTGTPYKGKLINSGAARPATDDQMASMAQYVQDWMRSNISKGLHPEHNIPQNMKDITQQYVSKQRAAREIGSQSFDDFAKEVSEQGKWGGFNEPSAQPQKVGNSLTDLLNLDPDMKSIIPLLMGIGLMKGGEQN